ncbi:MAG: inositol monophosphatase [Nanoarchaeota archaeon]|nr:inositol monophosphatase [Nanoarchaeota archaeon]
MKDFIIGIAEEAANLAKEMMGKAKVSSKGPKDVVTEADKAVETMLILMIRTKFPTHQIISEETGETGKKSEYVWYIDPIDGTSNYSHTDPHYCVSIGLAKNDVMTHACIVIPALNETYYAEKGKGAFLNDKKISVSKIAKLEDSMVLVGVKSMGALLEPTMKAFKHFSRFGDRARDYGFTAGELCFVAAGRAEAIVRYSQNAWDIAAGSLIVEEAGGRFTGHNGQEIKINGNDKFEIVASNSVVHDNIIKELKGEAK